MASSAIGRVHRPLCRDHALTPYDALYVELAQRSGSPLATLDQFQKAPLRRSVSTFCELAAHEQVQQGVVSQFGILLAGCPGQRSWPKTAARDKRGPVGNGTIAISGVASDG